ncbi:MAG: hypothetical protein WC934_08325 [Acidithiobacillus sp.]|uniref:hypothetical protein n=1 Tax=Acidithiobacillus sp. TaxID=1872118 RepID=UPI00356072A8
MVPSSIHLGMERVVTPASIAAVGVRMVGVSRGGASRACDDYASSLQCNHCKQSW